MSGASSSLDFDLGEGWHVSNPDRERTQQLPEGSSFSRLPKDPRRAPVPTAKVGVSSLRVQGGRMSPSSRWSDLHLASVWTERGNCLCNFSCHAAVRKLSCLLYRLWRLMALLGEVKWSFCREASPRNQKRRENEA